MKNIYNHFLFPLSLSLIIFSCNDKENSETIQKIITLPEGVLYKLDMTAENIEINWKAYKTNDRTPVLGEFSEFSSDRNGKEYERIEDLVGGLNFSISSLSSSSADDIRDLNLKNYFC